jgi:CBS domain-containing protein
MCSTSGPEDYAVNIGEFCSGRVFKVAESASLQEVARLMTHEKIGAVIVTHGASEQSAVCGIITDRDIVTAQLDRTADLSSLNAADAMTRKVLTLTKDLPLDSAIAHMRARNVRRAPVVTEEGVPVGLISIDDLLAQLSVKLVGVVGIVARQARREPLETPG